jgi:hypothetical protein
MKLRFGFFGEAGLNEFQNELGEGFGFTLTRGGREYRRIFPNVGQPDQNPPVHVSHRDDPDFLSDVRLLACRFRPFHALFTVGGNRFEFTERKPGITRSPRIVVRMELVDEVRFFTWGVAAPFGALTRVGEEFFVGGAEWDQPVKGSVTLEVSDHPFLRAWSAGKKWKERVQKPPDVREISALPVFFNLTVSKFLSERFYVPVNKAWIPFIAEVSGLSRKGGGPLVFAWDGAFSAIILAGHDSELAKKCLLSTLDAMRPDGRLPQLRVGNAISGRSNPPVWFIAAEHIYRKTHDRDFVRGIYDDLVRNYRWFKRKRMGPYWTFSWGADNPEETAAIRLPGKIGAVYESGLDDSPLFDGMELSEGLLDHACIDLTCLVYRACETLRFFSGILGRDSAEFDADSELFRKSVHLFFDFNRRIANSVKFGPGVRSFAEELTPASFYPLLTPYLSPEEVELLRELYRSRNFRGRFLLPSLSYRSKKYNGDGDYWRGRIWPPMVWLTACGFADYDAAIYREIRQAAHELLVREWKRDGHVHENYSAETGYGEPAEGVYARSCPLYSWGGLLGVI